MKNRALISALPFLVLSLACTSKADRARADSAQALAEKQRALIAQLSAQKDSINGIVDQADAFIGQIDKSISRVKGLPRGRKHHFESALDAQVQARKDMLNKVNALVARAQATAKELDEARKQQAALLAENQSLKDSLGADAQRIAALTDSIAAKAQMIALLQAKVDTLDASLNEARAAYAKAYYVIGTEDELVKEGIIVKEGGANFLVAHVGRTLVPARHLKSDLFRTIDTREVAEIPVPDTTKTYQIVSRQSLDDATVAMRDGSKFRGPLHIENADRFWAPSKYLIIVER